jgi:hypothetical protein
MTKGGPIKKTTFALVDRAGSEGEGEDEDEQLQRALQLSLQTHYETSSGNANSLQRLDANVAGIAGMDNGDDCFSESKMPATRSVSTQYYRIVKRVPYSPIEFHSVMWDSALTTEQDKLRWLHESIRFHDGNANVNRNLRRPFNFSASNATPGTASAASSSTEPLGGGFLKSNPTSMLDVATESHSLWGLVQQYGGPCGVLAAVQAELLRLLLFERSPSGCRDDSQKSASLPQPITRSLIRHKLAESIGWILARAALTPVAQIPKGNAAIEKDADRRQQISHPSSVNIVLPAVTNVETALEWSDLELGNLDQPDEASGSPAPQGLTLYTIESACAVTSPAGAASKRPKFVENCNEDARELRLANAVASFLESPFQSDESTGSTQAVPLDVFMQSGGVLLVVMSLVATRGPYTISRESDDYGNNCKLTSQFGHCSQELMNLLLTGQAVSNAFDHTMEVADVVCRGISSQPHVGYLSQLEALRYCQVGEFYKNPRYPIWVVGSTSHFSVLFGGEEALRESQSDKLLERCRRAFKRYEKDECGFIDVSQLTAVSRLLDIDVDDQSIQLIAATIEVEGSKIILWDDFWKAFSRLLTGASVESVLQGGDSGELASSDGSLPNLVPALDGDARGGGNFDQRGDLNMVQAHSSYTASWTDSLCHSAASGNNDAPFPESPTMSSDEALARLIQAEWDAEVSAANSIVAGASMNSNDSNTAVRATSPGGLSLSDGSDQSDTFARLPPTPPPPAYAKGEDSKPAAKKPHDFETFGDSFSLYHYNGLRGGVLTHFRVTRLTAEEAVGASVALNRTHTSASGHLVASDTRDADLEDVVRTRWPSCTFDWHGNVPPQID